MHIITAADAIESFEIVAVDEEDEDETGDTTYSNNTPDDENYDSLEMMPAAKSMSELRNMFNNRSHCFQRLNGKVLCPQRSIGCQSGLNSVNDLKRHLFGRSKQRPGCKFLPPEQSLDTEPSISSGSSDINGDDTINEPVTTNPPAADIRPGPQSAQPYRSTRKRNHQPPTIDTTSTDHTCTNDFETMRREEHEKRMKILALDLAVREVELATRETELAARQTELEARQAELQYWRQKSANEFHM